MSLGECIGDLATTESGQTVCCAGCASIAPYNSKSNQETTLDERLMYEDLEQIAQLKFGKEMESISKETNDKVKEAQMDCPLFCTRWIVSVAQGVVSISRRRRGCGEVGSA